jgi:hypothetical protein
MAKITHFKKAWLKGVKLIGRTYGKVELVVASTVTERNRINATEPGKSDKYIVTLRAIPADKFAKIKELFANTEEVPVEQMKDVFLTASIWINDPENLPKLPMKGEIVVGNIDLVPTREDRSKYVLRVQHIALQPAEVAPVLDWDGFFDEVPNSEQVPAVMTTEDISH